MSSFEISQPAPPGSEASDKPTPPEETRRSGLAAMLAIIALFAAAHFVWTLASSRPQARPPRGAAPDFEVLRVDREAQAATSFHLQAERGHPVLVDFFATWCGPCKESLPLLDEAYQDLKGQGVRAIAIETDGNGPGAREFAQNLNLHLPVGIDSGEVSTHYGVSSIPYLVLVGADGNIKRIFRGVHSSEEIRRAVRAELAAK